MDYLVRSDVQLIVLSARWHTLFYRSVPPSTFLRHHGAYIDISLTGETDSTAPHKMLMKRALQRTVRKLQLYGKTVVVVGAAPEPGWDVPIKFVRAKKDGINASTKMRVPREFVDSYISSTNGYIRESTGNYAVFLPIEDLVCTEEFCDQVANNELLYVDARSLFPIIVTTLSASSCSGNVELIGSSQG